MSNPFTQPPLVASAPTAGKGLSLDLAGNIPFAIRRKLPGYTIGFDTGPGAAVTSTTEASGTVVIAASQYAFDGLPVRCTVFVPEIQTPTAASGALQLSLFEGSVEIGILGAFYTELLGGQMTTAVTMEYSGTKSVPFAPSKGLHTYTVTGFVSANVGAPGAYGGAGGTGTNVPVVIRFTKV